MRFQELDEASDVRHQRMMAIEAIADLTSTEVDTRGAVIDIGDLELPSVAITHDLLETIRQTAIANLEAAVGRGEERLRELGVVDIPDAKEAVAAYMAEHRDADEDDAE